MLKLMKVITASAAVLSASAATANAFDLYGFIKSNTSQFSGPVVLTMHKTGDDFRLKSATTSVPISYEAGVKGVQSYLVRVDVRVDHITKGEGPTIGLRRQLDGTDEVSGNTNLPMTRAHLAPLEKVGQDVCASHQGPGEKTVNTTIPLEMVVTYHSTNVFAPGHGQQSFTREGSVPATIVCEAPVTPKSPPKVSLMQLKLYTIPARPVCGKPVVVMAEFFVNYPGPYNFKYFRDNGDHQDTSVTAASAVPVAQNLYMQRWSRTYTFTKTENRKYRIIPQGSPLTTDWVDVSVHCTGGIASPQPNTGNAPKQGAFKPVIAPAKIKIAPVLAPATLKPKAEANAEPRAFRHIGKKAVQ
jgi:hypothetical protein